MKFQCGLPLRCVCVYLWVDFGIHPKRVSNRVCHKEPLLQAAKIKKGRYLFLSHKPTFVIFLSFFSMVLEASMGSLVVGQEKYGFSRNNFDY